MLNMYILIAVVVRNSLKIVKMNTIFPIPHHQWQYFFPKNHKISSNSKNKVLVRTLSLEKLDPQSIKGISNAKYLSKLLKNYADIIVIQKRHCESEQELQKRGKIPSYEFLGATYHQT